jgi:ElaA protein
MKYSWQIKHYNELTINEFHDLIALRINVFVVEQNCPYPELDGKDKKSYHAMAWEILLQLPGFYQQA